MKIKRILIKLSGEQFGGEVGKGIDTDIIQLLAEDIKKTKDKHDVEVAIVVGGGNFIRGAELHKSENLILESTAHYMGMLATIMNSMALNDILESKRQTCRMLLKLEANKISEGFTRLRAVEHLKKGRVVIVAGGTGNPFVTTDTASVSAALELGCDLMVKITKVDGVYDKDPNKVLKEGESKAVKYEKLSFDQVFKNADIKVMDKAAISLAEANNLPIYITKLEVGMLDKILENKFQGTIIY
jgi:uridylate kinase